ncbi:hypothetical protein [Streptomyces alanosinicus]|uniref:Uncharacterized protein n=1 Tax=Streptomyces alanosinicus TaxID=68171 RepID=A0A918YU40_9ACTN|nr:hypothetical protein [Streptomyces alanosinicus]GHE15297.1 hypothetical protein GCM10010339_89480 [Streptomyces alanosinicus]
MDGNNARAVLPGTVLIAEDLRDLMGPEHVEVISEVCRYTPVHGCAICGHAIDLRVQHASVLLRVRRNAEGAVVDSSSCLAHALCAPSQISPWEIGSATRLMDRSAVPGDRVQTHLLDGGSGPVPVLLVELGMVTVTVSPAGDGTRTLSDMTTQNLLWDGLARLTSEREVGQLHQLNGWHVELTWDGLLGPVRCPPDARTGRDGIFLSPTDINPPVEASWRDEVTRRGWAAMVVAQPGSMTGPDASAEADTIPSGRVAVENTDAFAPVGFPAVLAGGRALGARIPVHTS